MGLHLGHDPNTLYAKYTGPTVETFEGVTIDELQKAETLFEVNIIVYKLSGTSAQLVRRSLCMHANTIYLNLHETHFSLIHDIKAYSHSYKCSKCEHSLWKYPACLERHELTCEAGVRHVTKVGCTTRHHPCSTFGRWRNHRRRDAEILPLSSNIRLRMRLSMERIYLPTATASSGSPVTFRWVWVRLPTCQGTSLRAVMSQPATRTNWWALWCAVSVPLATQHLICWYHRTIMYWTSWRCERRLGNEAERKALKEDESKQEDHDGGGRDGGGQDKSLQNVDWTTARLVTSVTGHRLQLGKVWSERH